MSAHSISYCCSSGGYIFFSLLSFPGSMSRPTSRSTVLVSISRTWRSTLSFWVPWCWRGAAARVPGKLSTLTGLAPVACMPSFLLSPALPLTFTFTTQVVSTTFHCWRQWFGLSARASLPARICTRGSPLQHPIKASDLGCSTGDGGRILHTTDGSLGRVLLQTPPGACALTGCC